jgi:hypothetical protein
MNCSILASSCQKCTRTILLEQYEWPTAGACSAQIMGEAGAELLKGSMSDLCLQHDKMPGEHSGPGRRPACGKGPESRTFNHH